MNVICQVSIKSNRIVYFQRWAVYVKGQLYLVIRLFRKLVVENHLVIMTGLLALPILAPFIPTTNIYTFDLFIYLYQSK